MNKSIILTALLFGLLVGDNKAETTTNNSSDLERAEKNPENSPWDPRGHIKEEASPARQDPSDGSPTEANTNE